MEGRATLQMKVPTGANIHFPALLSKLTFRLTNTKNVPQLYFLHIKLELTQLLLLSKSFNHDSFDTFWRRILFEARNSFLNLLISGL